MKIQLTTSRLKKMLYSNIITLTFHILHYIISNYYLDTHCYIH